MMVITVIIVVTAIAVTIAIIIGLACTLFILSIYQKALPALPISIAFGLLFYFTTDLVISPCLDAMAIQGTIL